MFTGRWQLVIIVGVICGAGFALASDPQNPGTWHGGPPLPVPSSAPPAVPAKVRDAPQAVVTSSAAPVPSEVAESVSGTAGVEPRSTAERLRAMSAAERSNARLSLEGVEALGEVERQQVLQVEALWAQGRHDEAIGVLFQLEAAGAKLAAGIAWLQPVAGAPKNRGADVRIGAPRVGATDVALDFDQETGNLFAVVNWPSIPNVEWSLNMSSDDGASWSETFFAVYGDLIDAAVVDEFLYVATVNSLQPGHLTMRRFFVADGGLDGSYGSGGAVLVITVFPNTILDVAVGGNADYNDNRIYAAIIESNHAVRFFWDEVGDEDFEEESPVGTSAESGLDYHWGGGTLGASPNTKWLSYLGTDGGVHILGATAAADWTHYSMYPTLYGNETRTRISAYGNNVVVAYTAVGTNATAPGYHVSYNNGASWFYGFAYDPPAGAPGCYGVDVTARGGWGTGIVYNSGGTFDTVSMVAREDYVQGSAWNPPQTFNEVDAFSGAPSFIQYLRPLGAYGMVYLAGDSWDDSIPYFDLIPLMPFDDGFDFGDTSAWSNTVP